MIEKKIVPVPFLHQAAAEKFTENLEHSALFMEQGTGKSKVTIDIAYRLYMKGKINAVLIISPNGVKDQWVEEQFPTHYPEDEYLGYIWDSPKSKKGYNKFYDALHYVGLTVFSFNVEAFQGRAVEEFIFQILDLRKVFVVIDESTRIKNGRRQGRGKRAGAKRTNKILDLFEKVKYKSILTGTPITKSPFDLWSQFEFLKKDFFGMDFFIFQHRYGIMLTHATGTGQKYQQILSEKEYSFIKSALKQYKAITPRAIEDIADRFGMSTKNVLEIRTMKEYTGFKNLDELKSKISTVTFFQKLSDCTDLPEKVYETIKVDLSPEQKRLYTELKNNMFAEYEGKEISFTNKLTMALRLQMITGGLFPFRTNQILINSEGEEICEENFDTKPIDDNAKIKAILEDLDDQDPDTFKIIWARFRGEIELIERALLEKNYTCEKYYGGSSPDVIKRFKNKEFKILISSQIKGGEGLNLQVANQQLYYSNLFIRADIRQQTEARSYRIGQDKTVVITDFICRGTLDESILKILKSRGDLINFFKTTPIKEIF